MLATLQDGEQFGFFGGEIFFGIDAAVDGEPALLGDDIEICAATAFSTEHEDGVTGLLRADIEAGDLLLDFAFELLELFDDGVHAFEGVFAEILQTDVSGLAEDADAKSDRAAIGVPHHAAGGFRQEHAESVAVEESLLG